MNTELPFELEKRSSPCVWEPVHQPDIWLSEYEKNGYIQFQSTHRLKYNQSTVDQIFSSDRLGRVLEVDGQTTRSQFNIHNDYPELISDIISIDIYQKAKLILGSEPIFYQSHINFKAPERGGGYEWHSDYCYWNTHDGMLEPRAISVVIPLTDHNPTNGGLQLIKGSHKYFYPHTLSTKLNWQMDRIRHDSFEKNIESGIISEAVLSTIQKEKIQYLNMQLGDYAIFDANTWHSSSVNKSQQNRTTLFLVLISNQTRFNESLKFYRPSYISCRKGVALSQFLGHN